MHSPSQVHKREEPDTAAPSQSKCDKNRDYGMRGWSLGNAREWPLRNGWAAEGGPCCCFLWAGTEERFSLAERKVGKLLLTIKQLQLPHCCSAGVQAGTTSGNALHPPNNRCWIWLGTWAKYPRIIPRLYILLMHDLVPRGSHRKILQ